MEKGERQSIEDAVKKQRDMLDAIRKASEDAQRIREEREAQRLQEEAAGELTS